MPRLFRSHVVDSALKLCFIQPTLWHPRQRKFLRTTCLKGGRAVVFECLQERTPALQSLSNITLSPTVVSESLWQRRYITWSPTVVRRYITWSPTVVSESLWQRSLPCHYNFALGLVNRSWYRLCTRFEWPSLWLYSFAAWISDAMWASFIFDFCSAFSVLTSLFCFSGLKSGLGPCAATGGRLENFYARGT